MPPDVNLELVMHKIEFVARTLPRMPLGELTALPRPPSGITGGPLHGQGVELNHLWKGLAMGLVPLVLLIVQHILHLQHSKCFADTTTTATDTTTTTSNTMACLFQQAVK